MEKFSIAGVEINKVSIRDLFFNKTMIFAYILLAFGTYGIYEIILERYFLLSANAFDAGVLGIKAPIKVRNNGEIIETSYGRLLFNEIVPKDLYYVNETLKKSVLKRILAESFETLGGDVTAQFVDKIKDFGYKYSTISGLSISAADMIVPDNKKELLETASENTPISVSVYLAP